MIYTLRTNWFMLEFIFRWTFGDLLVSAITPLVRLLILLGHNGVIKWLTPCAYLSRTYVMEPSSSWLWLSRGQTISKPLEEVSACIGCNLISWLWLISSLAIVEIVEQEIKILFVLLLHLVNHVLRLSILFRSYLKLNLMPLKAVISNFLLLLDLRWHLLLPKWAIVRLVPRCKHVWCDFGLLETLWAACNMIHLSVVRLPRPSIQSLLLLTWLVDDLLFNLSFIVAKYRRLINTSSSLDRSILLMIEEILPSFWKYR